MKENTYHQHSHVGMHIYTEYNTHTDLLYMCTIMSLYIHTDKCKYKHTYVCVGNLSINLDLTQELW